MLKKLRLGKNNLQSGVALEMAEALKVNKTLKTLILLQNNIMSVGKFIAIIVLYFYNFYVRVKCIKCIITIQ